MNDLERRVLDKVRDSVGADRLEKSIVYLDHNLRHAAERITAGDVVIDLPWDAHIAVIDLEPMVNWGHACSYLAIRCEGSDVLEFAAHMPPFLKAGGSTFRLLWRGPRAPEWAVAVAE
jgi:hypothetical protein